MSTAAQITANRANAQLSTGPRTADGKLRVAQNGTTHGLASRNVFLKGESLEQWIALREQLRADLQVEGHSSFLDDATHATWKLMRIEQWQAMIVESAFEGTPVPDGLARLFGENHETVLKRLERYERSTRTALKRAIDFLRALQKARALEAASRAAAESDAALNRPNPFPVPDFRLELPEYTSRTVLPTCDSPDIASSISKLV